VFVLGLLTFGSVFVTGVMNFGNFHDFDGQVRSAGLRAVAGMAMFMAGGVLMGIGRAGLAGSGVVLDPQRAREDLEPWSRMAGGMVKDTLDEAGISIGSAGRSEPDFADRLRKIHALKEEGILTKEEYEREKAEILERN
jgi:hypothetical protein